MNLRTAARKAYKGTKVAELRQLFAEETRWQRKATIARNKLSDVRARIDKLSEDLAIEQLHSTGLVAALQMCLKVIWCLKDSGDNQDWEALSQGGFDDALTMATSALEQWRATQ